MNAHTHIHTYTHTHTHTTHKPTRPFDVQSPCEHLVWKALREHLMLNIFDVDSYTGALRTFDVAHSMLTHTPELLECLMLNIFDVNSYTGALRTFDVEHIQHPMFNIQCSTYESTSVQHPMFAQLCANIGCWTYVDSYTGALRTFDVEHIWCWLIHRSS